MMDNTRKRPRINPPTVASARKEVEWMQEYLRQRNVEATARRLETLRLNVAANQPRPPRDDRPLRMYVPVRLDLATVPRHLRWFAAYFTSTVHLHWVRRWRWLHKKGERAYVRLCHRLLRKVIPEKSLVETKKLLIGNGILECDRAWAPGKAFGYRLADDYRETAVVVCYDTDLCAKVRGLYAHQERDLRPVHRALREDLERMVFDMDRARPIIATLKPKKKRRQVPLSTAEYRQCLLDHAEVLANGDHYLKVDDYGRVHTSVTSTSKKVLGCLRLRDERGEPQPVTWIDLANSQPRWPASWYGTTWAARPRPGTAPGTSSSARATRTGRWIRR
jgi:hypothetical protein